MLHNLQRQGKLVTPKPAGEGARNRHEPHVLASLNITERSTP